MTGSADAAVAEIADAHHRGRAIVLLLDYDGTLTPIVDNRHHARLDPQRREQLAALSAVPNVSLGVISGRTLSDLQDLVGLPLVYYAGVGGMEIDLKGERLRHPEERAAVQLMYVVGNALEPVLASHSSASLECKPAGLTLHWGYLAAGERAILRAELDRALQPWAEDVIVLEGRLAVDILARAGWHKGSAVDLIAAHVAARDPLVVYAGDEANDEHAFSAVRAMHGVTIAVGSHAPASAGYRLTSPDQLGELLSGLLDALTGARLDA